MNNAEKFKSQFGLYASELWAMPEKEFLMWLNAEFQPAVPEMAIDAVIADVLLSEKSEMEERTMADLIDRQALRLMKTEECAGHSIEYAMGWKACIEWIRAMPSAQPEPKWIPCSERLPVVEYDALGNWCSEEVILLMNNEEFTRVCNGHFNPIGVFEVYESNGPAFVGIPVKDVFAWMTLPEPYMEE